MLQGKIELVRASVRDHFSMIMLLMGIYLLGWMTQQQLLLNWDISYFLQTAPKLFTHKTYTHDFFENNPPLIFFLYVPVLILTKLTGISVIVAFRAYIFFIGSLLLLICAFLLKKIMGKNELVESNAFLMTLAVTFFVLPLYEFGQREHLLFMLTMPYLLVVEARLKSEPINPYLAISIGLLAGIGFALKPYFLITPLLLELYVLFNRRIRIAWMRPETLAIFGLSLIYVSVIFIFYPDYVTVVVPFALRNYYQSVGDSYKAILSQPLLGVCLIAMLLGLLQYKKHLHKSLNIVLILAMLGYLLSFIMLKALFFYHLIPAFSIAVLLLVFSFCTFIQRLTELSDYLLMSVLIAAFFILYLHYDPAIWTTLLFYPPLFFSFFAGLFAVLFYLAEPQQHKNILKIMMTTIGIIALGSWCAYISQRMPWHRHSFVITISILLSLFALFASKANKSLYGHLITVIFGMLIFAYPIKQLYFLYQYSLTYKASLQPLISFLHGQSEQRKIYFFATKSYYSAVMHAQTNAIDVQRFPFLWMIAGLIKQEEQTKNKTSAPWLADRNFIIEGIADDLHQYKPDYIFVDTSKNKYRITNKNFEYIPYFSHHQKFLQEWQSYRYLTTIFLSSANVPTDFSPKLDVYIRKLSAY